MTTDRSTPKFDVAVVGAGQAGLAIGYFLARQGLRFVILDRADSIGAAWRERWDSLVLFTPRRYDSLPGLPLPGDADGYPSRDEVVAYLEHYAKTYTLPIQLDSAVNAVTNAGGTFVLGVDDRTLEADQVVVATGPFQMPRVPQFAAELAPDVFQIHSVDYRAPSDIPRGTVVVVGGGNTGYQIASELSTTHHVHLAVGGRQTPLPQRLLGRDLFWWLMTTGLLKTTVDSRFGQKLRNRDTLIGSSPRAIKRDRVEIKPRATSAVEHAVRFADGTDLSVDGVIWATGFTPDHSWINLPITNQDGTVVHRRGVSDIPGLYFVGLQWQHTRGSALLGWVKDDAQHVARHLAARATSSVASPPVAVPAQTP
jgi:putative flavoprotein involved in K+ transport